MALPVLHKRGDIVMMVAFDSPTTYVNFCGATSISLNLENAVSEVRVGDCEDWSLPTRVIASYGAQTVNATVNAQLARSNRDRLLRWAKDQVALPVRLHIVSAPSGEVEYIDGMGMLATLNVENIGSTDDGAVVTTTLNIRFEDGVEFINSGQVLTAPLFTSMPSLLGSTALGGTITINLGAASGVPAPVLSGTLSRPGVSPVTVTQGQQITIASGDQGGSLSLTAVATNSQGSDTETVARSVPAADPTTAPVPFAAGDWSLATGLEANQLVVNINALPADGGSAITAIQYSANSGTWTPLGGAGTGSRTLTMPAAGTSYSVRLRAVNAAGNSTPSDTKTATSGAAAPSLSRLAVHIDSDIDTVGERDDIAAMALWLGNQEDFNLLGFTCSPPDGNHQEYINCINAYASDRAEIISKPGITASDFKTGAELLSLVVDGANTDAPSRGYRLPGEGQYAEAHAAAQRLIANARDHGDPISADPTRKLWVAVQGGYVTLAQALYEAMDPAGPMELPDILDRIRVVGQPNWNSRQAPNSWNYIFGNAWPASGTPGMFGDLWMICGYLQWHAFNRDNGTTDTTFWNEITARSAFGTHLRNTLTRPSGTFRTPHFRAGDAGIWFWLKSAKDLGNFDPTNPANLCGAYRTYEGRNPWPSQTVGYGAGSGIQTANPNPEGITWSPTIWAPELTVDSYADAYAAVDLDAWYSMVRGFMARYQTEEAVLPANLVGEWLMMTDGSIPEAHGADLTGIYAAPNADPSVEAEGTFFDGNDYARVTAASSQALNLIDNAAFVAVIIPGNLTGDKIFLARDNGGANGHFQFRVSNGMLQFLDRRQTTVIAADTESLVAEQAYLVTATVSGGQIVLRKNGVQVASVATANTPYSLTAEMTFGCRQATSGGAAYADRFSGRMAYAAIWKDYPAADIEALEQRALAAVAGRSARLDAITLP